MTVKVWLDQQQTGDKNLPVFYRSCAVDCIAVYIMASDYIDQTVTFSG